MFKPFHFLLALGVFAGLSSESAAKPSPIEGPRIVVGENEMTNPWCLDNTAQEYKYQLQYVVGKVRVGSRTCTGTLINNHNGILTSSECEPPPSGSRAQAATFEIYGGDTQTCEGTEPQQGLVYTTTVVRVDHDLGVLLLRGGNRTNGWVTTPSDYTMGANLDPGEPATPASVTLVGYQGAVKKVDPTCQISIWSEGGRGRHTCDTLPGVGAAPETAVGSPIFNDLGPDSPLFFLPVVAMHRGKDPLSDNYNDAISIGELAWTGFLDGEIDTVWH